MRRVPVGLFGVVAILAAGAALAGEEPLPKSGRIYVTATLTAEGGILAVDPETGEAEPVLQRGGSAVRVAPDGRRLVFWEKDSLRLIDRTQPDKVTSLCDGDCQGIWSADGKSLLIGLIKSTPRDGKGWACATLRIKADGSGREALPIPKTEYVEDWSPDGKWVVTTSLRHMATERRHVYRMRTDGTGERRLTTRGDNLHARISPDGRSLAYLHLEPEDKSLGVWVMDAEGHEPRKVYQIDGTHPEVCWSPDGKHLALSIYNLTELGGISREAGGCRIELIDLKGENRVVLPLPQTTHVGNPDWR